MSLAVGSGLGPVAGSLGDTFSAPSLQNIAVADGGSGSVVVDIGVEVVDVAASAPVAAVVGHGGGSVVAAVVGHGGGSAAAAAGAVAGVDVAAPAVVGCAVGTPVAAADSAAASAAAPPAVAAAAAAAAAAAPETGAGSVAVVGPFSRH